MVIIWKPKPADNIEIPNIILKILLRIVFLPQVGKPVAPQSTRIDGKLIIRPMHTIPLLRHWPTIGLHLLPVIMNHIHM